MSRIIHYEPKKALIQFPSLWLPGSPLPSSRGLGRRCCCGPPPCTQFEDNFDRSNNTNIGSDWSEEEGDWSIASNKLSISSANALCLCQASLDHPYSLEVVYNATTLNDLIKIVFNYVDSDNYSFVLIEIEPDTFINFLKIVDRVGGVETVLVNTSDGSDVSTDIDVKLCVFNSYVILQTPGQNVSAHITSSSSVCGLGTGSILTGTVTFNNFVIHTPDSINPECSPSICDIDCDCSPDFDTLVTTHLEVEIAGIVNNSPVDCSDCSDLNDTYLLTNAICITTASRWRYVFPSGAQPCNAEELTVAFISKTMVLVNFEGIDGAVTYFRTPLGESIPSDTDCNSLENFNVPPNTVGTSRDCDNSSATCKITSITP